MELKELRESSATELNDELVKLRKEQFTLRMQEATGQLTQTSEYRRIRRTIARVKTILNEKR